jgi:amidohydrolase
MRSTELKIENFIAKNKDELLEHRRWFHQFPETSFKEYKTSNYIRDYLQSIGVDNIETVIKTGLVCKIGQGKYVTAGRFNMDGLPIPEKTELSFSSKLSGFSHACGHDFELAWGLMIAKYFQQNKPTSGTVKLIFQPAEEGPGEESHGKTGGQIFSELGIFNVNSILSLHVDPEVKLNTISISIGEVTCSAYDFEFILKGKTCHAAKPYQGINPINYLGKLIESIYRLEKKIKKIITDDEGYILITVSAISSRIDYEKEVEEESINTIPEFLIIKGITRFRTEKVEHELLKGLRAQSKKMSGLQQCTLTINKTAVATINNKNIVNNVIETANQNNIDLISKRTTWRDDAGWASQKAATAAHGFIGIDDGVPTNLHSPTFNPNEEGLLVGLKIFLGTMEKNLEKFIL